VSPRSAHSRTLAGLAVAVLGTVALGAGIPLATPAAAIDLSCDTAAQSIGSVQGPGAVSPLAGQVVVVAGVVVGDLQQGGFDGVVVQDGGDGDAATSDGVFAFGAAGPLDLGDRVVVRGSVDEYHGFTELTGVTVAECGTAPLPAAAVLPAFSTDAQRESLEGMLVAPAADLTVTGVHGLARYGQVLLSAGGRLRAPTEVADPGPASRQVAADNAARAILLDDGRTATLSTAAGGPPPYLTVDDPVRVGDTAVLGQPVVLTHGFGSWLLEPADGTADGTTFTATNPRPATPPTVGGDLRVADFNVLNYFVDLPGEIGDDARGATSAAELAQQQAKIVAALAALDADVVSLHEVENSAVLTPDTPYRAVETLLAALETETGRSWSHVAAHEDSDVITNAIAYRPDVVTPVGGPSVPADLSPFDNARSPIAQTFDASGEVFTVIANHLKSKGSACGADSDDTSAGGAGNCNGDRVAQARALVVFADEVAEHSGDPDVLLTGDFNAYRFEDPVDVVTAAGYTDMAPVLAPDEHSYVYDGGSGSLDHVFASPSMLPKLTGLGVWDVNAAESSAYQYDGYEPLYAGSPYRASDHDPTLVGISTQTAATAALSADRPFRGDRMTVTGSGFASGEEVAATLPSRNRGQLGSAVAGPDGAVQIAVTVPTRLPAGDQQVLLTGDSGETASTGFSLRPPVVELLLRLVGFAAGR
jgi:predicted extracellular nuclease